MEKGYVYLIGAGCGSMDLITLRGLRALEHCDAVVYDDLIDEDLLSAAPVEAQRIYMGKRSGRHSAPQEEISQALVNLALRGKTVARLKGGDPFVFGRGGEEAIALEKAGIGYEVVPGISSSIAIPSAAGIPVTHRRLSRSFHVVTGRSADGTGLPEDLEQLAKLHGTLIFLMGLGNLEKIAEGLLGFGKDPETPAAVISGGNSENPMTVRGNLQNISRIVREAGVQSPAVIVIGRTAGLEFLTKKPLQDVVVGITGTDSMAEKLKTGLREQGARVVRAEHSLVEPIPLDLDLKSLCDGKKHWLVFTSANGVRLFFKTLRERKTDFRCLAGCKFAVIGSSTGKLLREYGIYADLCPEVYTSEELAKKLCATVSADEEVLLIRADNGAVILPQMLQERGIPTRDIPIYSLRADPETKKSAEAMLDRLDYLTFSSGGGVELFLKEYGRIPARAQCVCIGDVTAQALRRHGYESYLMAEEISADGIISAILKKETSR